MTAWRMAFRAGTKGVDLWPQCRDLGVAAIQYSPVDGIDLSRYSAENLPAAWAALKASQKASLRRFAYEMKKGDVIYVKDGPLIVGKGVIRGPYRFDRATTIAEPVGVRWQHQIPIDWAVNFQEANVLVGQSQQFTVESITADDVLRIERAAGNSSLHPEDACEEDPADSSRYAGARGDQRESVWQQIRERRGQGKFRDALLKRYKNRCLVTGCTLVDVLEAAHIDPYRGPKHHHVENGLVLRADIHTLFDLNLLGIEPDSLCLELHPDVAAAYPDLAGTALGCSQHCRPSSAPLTRRYNQFLARTKNQPST